MAADVVGALPPAIQKTVEDFFAWWASRTRRGAARDAAVLTFWRDGMLQHLELIAKGGASKATFSALKKDFERTKQPVQEAIARLSAMRRKLSSEGAYPVAQQVDIILSDKQLGKKSIRNEIEYILRHPNDGDVSQIALQLCNRIEALNAAIARLQRLAFPS